jgi:hypothetical protein
MTLIKLSFHLLRHFLKKIKLAQRGKFWILLYILLIIVAGFGIIKLFTFISNQQILNSLTPLNTPNTPITLSAADALKDPQIQEANTQFELPADQPVTAGIIKDINTLKGKADFFKKAKNGDILLIYPDMVVIYDPENKVIRDINKTDLLK